MGQSLYDRRVETYMPYGNPGPGLIAPVKKIGRRGETCQFDWLRTAKSDRSRRSSESIPTSFVCPTKLLFNVSAYKAGDYKIFYADPRTRADYLQWAKFLLTAEDYINGKYKKDE